MARRTPALIPGQSRSAGVGLRPFLYRHDLTVVSECTFNWYWLADACFEADLQFVLAHALYLKLIHGGKNKNDRNDSEKLAHLLRSALHIIANQTFFLPPSLHRRGTRDQIRDYYVKTWPKVLVKWRDSGAILDAVAEGAPLRKWRDMAQELYDVNLDLRSPQIGRK